MAAISEMLGKMYFFIFQHRESNNNAVFRNALQQHFSLFNKLVKPKLFSTTIQLNIRIYLSLAITAYYDQEKQQLNILLTKVLNRQFLSCSIDIIFVGLQAKSQKKIEMVKKVNFQNSQNKVWKDN